MIISFASMSTVIVIAEDITIPFSHRLSDEALKDHIIDYKIIENMSVNLTDDKKEIVYEALDKWQNDTELGDYIKFREIKNATANTDIIYLVVEKLPDSVVGQTQTSYYLHTENDTLPIMHTSWIKIAIKGKDNNSLPNDEMIFTAMHETGHALGLDRSEPEGYALVMNALVLKDVETVSECEADAVITNHIKIFDKFNTKYIC